MQPGSEFYATHGNCRLFPFQCRCAWSLEEAMFRSNSTRGPLGKCFNLKPLLQSRQLRRQRSSGRKTGGWFATAARCILLREYAVVEISCTSWASDTMTLASTTASWEGWEHPATSPSTFIPLLRHQRLVMCQAQWQHAFFLFFVSVANILGIILPSPSVPGTAPHSMVANNDGMLFVPARFVGGQFYVVVRNLGTDNPVASTVPAHGATNASNTEG